MPRYDSNRLLVAKLETTAGTDAAPAAATDCVLFVGDVQATTLDPQYAQRNVAYPFFGGSQDLLAASSAKISFSVEFCFSGVAGTAPPWAPLLQACAFGLSSMLTPTRVEFWPVSQFLKTITLDFYDDGVKSKMVGAMGSVKLVINHKETPKLQFEFVGARVPDVAVANPTAALGSWKPPLPVAKANVTDITLGCNYAAGVLSGGVAYGSLALEIDLGNALKFFTTNSSERAEITGRDGKCNYELEMTAANEVAETVAMSANTLTTLGFTLGSAAGNKALIYLPCVHRRSIKKSNRDGIRTLAFEASLPPKSGNDDVAIILL